MRRFGPYVWRYRWRAASVLGLGLATGFLMKAPLLLLNTLVNRVFGIKIGGGVAEVEGTEAIVRHVDHAVEWMRLQIVAVVPALDASGDPRLSLVVAIGIGVLIISVVGALIQLLFIQLSRALSIRMLADLREDLASHVLKLGMRYHTASRKGDLLSRATTDISILLVALSLLFDDLIIEPAQLIGSLLLAFAAMPEATIVALAVIPMVAIPLLIFGRKVRKGTRKSLAALGASTETMSQMFAGIRVVKAFRMEEKELDVFRESNRTWIYRYMSVIRAKAKTESATLILTNVGFAAIICILGVVQIRTGIIRNMGALTVWFTGLATIYQHVRRIAKAYQTVQESMGAAERLFEVLDQKPSATDSKRGTARLGAPVKTLELKNVTFRYESEPVIDGVSFTARAGEIIAIVGPSGAGKSTLLDLVARFYDSDSGAILANGTDIRDLEPDHWFGQWALVDQQPFLFHASIRENVKYGKPDATDAEVREALRAANLLEFVESLPNGIDNEVGDRGARISGGQRQRITIARALLKNPSILLLDEVTSALDAESEQAVREALDRLMQGRTSLVVAHRLSTIRNATRILVLDRGRLVEQGTHEELLKVGGVYRKLYDMQFGLQA